MVANMRDNGKLIKRTEREFSTIQMEIFTKVDGSMIRRMGKEFILIRTELNMSDNGKMISSMVLVFKNGLMARNTRASIEMGPRLEKVFFDF